MFNFDGNGSAERDRGWVPSGSVRRYIPSQLDSLRRSTPGLDVVVTRRVVITALLDKSVLKYRGKRSGRRRAKVVYVIVSTRWQKR